MAECPTVEGEERRFIPNVIVLGCHSDYWFVVPLKRNVLSCQMTLDRPFATRRLFTRQYRPMQQVALQSNPIDFEWVSRSAKKHISSDDWDSCVELHEVIRLGAVDQRYQMLLHKYQLL